MKKGLLAIVIVFQVAQLHAQAPAIIEKGKLIVGVDRGSLSYIDYTNTYCINYKTYAPHIMYGVRKNLGIGAYIWLNPAAGSRKISFNKNDHYNEIGAYIKKYIPVTKHLYGYGQGSLSYITNRTNVNNLNYSGFKTINAKIDLGVGIKLGKRVFLEAGANVFNAGYCIDSKYPMQSNYFRFQRPYTIFNGVHIGLRIRL